MRTLIELLFDIELPTERNIICFMFVVCESGDIVVHKTDGTIETIKKEDYKFFGGCLFRTNKEDK